MGGRCASWIFGCAPCSAALRWSSRSPRGASASWRVRGGVLGGSSLAARRQRAVRRLAEALGLKVEWLHRVAYGPVRLGRLAEGKYRRLAAHEVAAIERLEG